MQKGKDYDYEVTVGMIKTICTLPYQDGEKVVISTLPTGQHSVYHWDGWLELGDALKKEKIKDSTLHYKDLCCKELDRVLSTKTERDTKVIDLIKEYTPELENGHRKEEYQRVYYCPYCGKRILFSWKLLGTFKLGKVKKEVCTYIFDKVD